MKKVVYCEIEFLRKFLDSKPLLESNDESLRLVDSWMSFYLFFCKADIILNISTSEFRTMANDNPWLSRLWKKSTDNQCGLEFDGENFPDISSLNGGKTDDKILNAVFLTNLDYEDCSNKSKELGVFVLNPEMAMHCNHLFCDSGTAFPDEKAKDWNFLKGLTGTKTIPPISISNSMLIIDNYILSDDRDIDYQKKIEYNLKPILQNILPLKLSDDETYDITIFVGGRSGEKNQYDAQYNYLNTLINTIRKDLKYRLAIFIGRDSDKFHDRSIVTNNVLINSGYGFGILRKDGTTSSPTSVNIVFPFFQSKIAWCDNSYVNIMYTAKKIISRLHEPNINCWGDHEHENRLISYYNPSPQKPVEEVIQIKSIDLSSHRNGRIVGKIDLSQFSDSSKRGHLRR